MDEAEASARETSLAHRKAAAAHRDGGRLGEAVAALRAAILTRADDADAHAELGLTLLMMGQAAEAAATFERALELQPADVFALSNLGACRLRLKEPDAAEACFRRVLALDPQQQGALRNLGVLLKESGRLDEAKALLRQAAAQDPSLELALQAYLSLSPVVPSLDDIAGQRRSFAEGLDALATSDRAYAYDGAKLNTPWFYLAYHAQDDRELNARTAQVLAAKVRVAGPPDPDFSAWRGPQADGRRTRVVFCSEFFFGHTIGRLYRGFIQHLDRSRFEVIVVHGSHSTPDAFRAEFDRLADQAIALPRDPGQQREIVARLKPDVLFFPDLGMSAQTWFLAQARLAPVQAVSWGHPDTTGLDTIDYFVSADAAEPAGAEAAYGERLVRLPVLPTCYPLPERVQAIPRAALRLPEAGTIYACPQSAFKFHPDFDAVLAGIARRDPSGHIVLIEGANPAWTNVLRQRWAVSHPGLVERALFLPRMSHEGFMALLTHVDVLLDPLHFGSGNNLYEAMIFGTPMVTWPGRFMRARLVAAAYAQMGVADAPVADTIDAYAAIAVGLGQDPERRAALGQQLRERSRAHLFNDLRAVRALEAFFDAAVAAAAAGERLPSGWRPDLTETPA